jgi:hypothetical protein
MPGFNDVINGDRPVCDGAEPNVVVAATMSLKSGPSAASFSRTAFPK